MRTLLKKFCKLKVNYYFCSIIINIKTMNTNTEWARASMKFIFNFEGDIWKENARLGHLTIEQNNEKSERK